MDRPALTLTGVVLEAPDAQALAQFYVGLLGWSTHRDEPGWVMLTPPGGGAGLSFQTDKHYVRPVWPAGPGDPPMMVHLDVQVDDLAMAGAYAEEVGATLAEFQPQEGVRVYLDPAGHPFCLYVEE